MNSEIRYTAFGTIRYQNGITPTDYRYTGQLQQAVIGLDYYNARWYDPQLGRFIQADTLVANPYAAAGFDRFSYVNNNPINYSDPLGRCARAHYSNSIVSDIECESASYTDLTENEYGISISGVYTSYEAKVVYNTINTMASGLDKVTGGHGKAWIQKNLDKVNIDIGLEIIPFSNNSVTIGSTVFLAPGFEKYIWSSPDNRVDTMIIHELGHVIDNRSSPLGMGDLTGGGMGDKLMQYVHGEITNWGLQTGLRFVNNSLTFPSAYRGNEFGVNSGWGYGNNSPADYFAQTFSGTIYNIDNPNLPKNAALWMSAYINSIK